MADLLPNNFPVPQESAIASYDWTDIAEGTGNIIFYGFAMTSSSGETTGASNNAFYGDPNGFSTNVANDNYTAVKTLNFDVAPFNLPRTIKGTAYIEGSFAMTSAAGASGASGYVVFTIYKWDGATATSIGTATTETITSASASSTIASFCLKASLTQTHFKKGEILRLTAVCTGKKNAAGASNWILLACDPINRNFVGDNYCTITATSNHTSLKFTIPFRIDL